MVALIIIGIILAILVLILLLPVGVDVGYENEQFHLSAKVNGFLLQLIPRPPRSEEKKPKEKKPKKEKKKKEPKPEEEKKPKKKLELDFNMDEILELVKKALRSFGKFGRKLKVSRFVLHFTAAGRDPYNTAMTFAYVNAALSSLAPICAQRFTVKDCDVWTDVDFVSEKMRLDLGLAVTIRIGQILGVGLGLGFGALWILLKNKIRLKKERRELKKAGLLEEDGQTTEKGKETNNIQAEERMEANG